MKKDLDNLKKTKQKYVKMYTDELITEDEFRDYTKNVNAKIKEIEMQIKISNFSIASEDVVNKDIRQKIKEIENILSGKEFTNEGLKKIIDKINVNKNGNVEIILKGLTNFDYDNEVIVKNVDEDKGSKIKDEIVKKSDVCSSLTENCKALPSVHKDISERLEKVNPSLARDAKKVLEINKA